MEENEIEKVLVIDLATTGLNLLDSRIVAITCKSQKEERIFADIDEEVLLARFLAYALLFNIIAGFNILQYDFPLLQLRSLKYGLSIKDIKGKLLDLRQIYLCGNIYSKGRLRDFEQLLDISYPHSEHKKGDIVALWYGNCTDELHNFLLRDVRSTWTMLERAKASEVL